MGKHVRPSKTAVVTGTTTAGVMLAGAAVGVTPAAAAQPAAPPPPKPTVATAELEALVAKPAPAPAVPHYRVKAGDTLSGIAQRFCRSPAKWRQLWAANKGHIKNPDLIYPRELVRLVCDAVASLAVPSAPPPTRPGGASAAHQDHLAHEAHRGTAAAVTGAQGVIGGRALRAISNLVRERIDEGQDFSGTGPLFPVAPGTVTSTVPTGWPGSAYILEKLDAPIDGHGWVYYAEDIAPAVHPGQHVTPGTVLGQVYHGGTGIEIGFGTAVPGVAAAYGHYTDGVPTAEGREIAAVLAATAPPPPPRPHAAPPHVPAFPALARHLSGLGYDGEAMAALASYLLAHGYSATGAAGVLGCVAGESGGNPESVGMGGGGWIGWTPLRPGLVTGDRARDIQAQAAALIAYDNASGNVAGLNAQPTAAAAAWYYSAHFERPAVTGSDIRHEVVDAVYAALAG